MAAPRNIAAKGTQPHVVVAVVLGTSELVRDAVLRFVRGETTQLGKSWNMSAKEQMHVDVTAYAFGVVWQLGLWMSPAPAHGVR